MAHINNMTGIMEIIISQLLKKFPEGAIGHKIIRIPDSIHI